MSDNKCVACGQWSGRGHRCPPPATSGTSDRPEVVPSAAGSVSTSVPTRDAVAERVAAGKRLIYAQTHPYGAPKVMIRGGATKVPEVKQALKDAGFVWDGQSHGWKGYMYDEELEKVLDRARDMGASVEPYSD